MRTVKIKFVDFWAGFMPGDNYFFKLLSENFRVELSEKPEILVYSCYGTEYLRYDCMKVFYTGENTRPDYTGCDFAISFDYDDDPRHFRLPLYALYIDQAGSIDQLLAKITRDEALTIWRSKTKFCCMIVSNEQSKTRLRFFENLSTYKKVDSGGRVMNNIGGPVRDKMNFIKDYRFVFAFENSSHPGYTTEKIIEPLFAGCIPLYWGDPLVGNDFNRGCFLSLDNTKTEEEFIAEIIAIDEDEEKAVKILTAPKFTNGHEPDSINKEKLRRFFEKIIVASADTIPVARTRKKYIHLYRVKKTYYSGRIKGIVNRLIHNSK